MTLECTQRPYLIDIGESTSLRTCTILIATGAEYRKPPLEEIPQFEGIGVYYAATFMEAQLCSDEDVVVIGGGNSAGQAAVFLAQTARHVYILVRSGGLAETMSHYLVRRIEEHPGITLCTRTEIVRRTPYARVRSTDPVTSEGLRSTPAFGTAVALAASMLPATSIAR